MKIVILVSSMDDAQRTVIRAAKALQLTLRAPHHTATERVLPDEVDMAAGGILYLDEAAWFSKSALYSILRQAQKRALNGAELPLRTVLQLDPDDADGHARVRQILKFYGAVAEDVRL